MLGVIFEDQDFAALFPARGKRAWSPGRLALVLQFAESGYEIVRRDNARKEHEVTTATSINDIARDLTIWLAARDFPGRSTRQVSE
ncbi:hypothetical protein KV205_31685 [Streptomyces sp. SKN60]|uniref:hypothetical protein n=1 Tax=Streptomyces sp. SKN60 TaxID=2855506 RepID=UPI002247FEFC|nr:hypothetical protein [Streptomyces sp. SKN60]MCX2185039.1 hypothetical protein [Streptomyces sp. SKN60]